MFDVFQCAVVAGFGRRLLLLGHAKGLVHVSLACSEIEMQLYEARGKSQHLTEPGNQQLCSEHQHLHSIKQEGTATRR